MTILFTNEMDDKTSCIKEVLKMNKILTTLSILVFALFLNAYTSAAPIPIPDKYNLSNQLEQVHRFWRTQIIDFEVVDNQSVVIKTSPGHYYLLVLTKSSYELPFQVNYLAITNSGSLIREGLDSVIVRSPSHYYQTYPIERIFKISGSKQMRDVINQLQGQKTETHAY